MENQETYKMVNKDGQLTETTGAPGQKIATTEADQTQTQPGIRQQEVYKVSIKPPQFVKNDPELFFLQMEAQFRNSGITADQTKFDHVIASLEPTYVKATADIIRSPPKENKYDEIKRRLIDEYTDSEQRKLRRLLQEIELGDDKPSQLLRKMKNLAGSGITDDVIKSLWIQRLPENVRAVVSIADGDSTVWARQADKMMEITTFSAISSVKQNITAPTSSNTSDTSTEINQIQYLINEIKKIQTTVEQLKNGNRSNDKNNSSRSRSKTPVRKFPFCRYHYKFGAKAKKCIKPCDFPPTTENKMQPEN